jgi:hypothetical protein
VRIAAASNFIVGLDNVIATAAAAQGNPALLLTGILVTVPATVGAAFIDRLIDLIPALAWAGSGLLGWIAGETTASDSSIERHLSAGQAQPVELLAAASLVSTSTSSCPRPGWRSARPTNSRRNTKSGQENQAAEPDRYRCRRPRPAGSAPDRRRESAGRHWSYAGDWVDDFWQLVFSL